jgi:4-amino-4-deoxychorismate lyase
MKPGSATLINGMPAERVSIHDRGFQYGDGVFETIAVFDGRPLLWRLHLTRLQQGCMRLGITPPPDATQLQEEAEGLFAGTRRAVLKLVVTRGESGRGYAPGHNTRPTRVLERLPWPDYPAANARDGVDVCVCRTRMSRNPALAGLKHLNRLEQVLARSEWRNEYAEGLMLDEDRNVIEATASNVFLVVRGTLLTPDLSQSGIAGVMRVTVLDHAKALTIPYQIGPVSRDTLDDADEIFLTNSLIGIWPVRRVETRSYTLGPLTRRLQKGISGSHCFDKTG